MLKVFSYPSEEAETFIQKLLKRGSEVDPEIEKQVVKILSEVKSRGDDAIIEYTKKFDFPGATTKNLIVTRSEFEEAYRQIDDKFLEILRYAIKNIETFHKKQLQQSWFIANEDGTFVGQMIKPVTSVGLYVPGGTGGNTPLISTLLMTAIPAKIAGVSNIALASPPRSNGTIHPGLLVASQEIGVDCVYKMGSAWAIAAMAYGTELVKPVDVIAGPGNVYVTTAKKIVSGIVGIDVLAGPSEILIIADDTANPEYIAADLLSQAEHDSMASSILISTDSRLINTVINATKEQMEKLPRVDTVTASLENYGACFLVENLDRAMELANRIAPEHMEIHTKNPWSLIGKIKNAGAVFIGEYTPEPVGDYFAGPNHVLPTSGTARFASALGVDAFLKKISILHYPREALAKSQQKIASMARWEELEAHARSVLIRNKN